MRKALLTLAIISLISVSSFAGDINPSSAPGPTMNSLDQIYNIGASMRMPIGPLAAAKTRGSVYIQIDNIPGESKDPLHQDWIDGVYWVSNSVFFTPPAPGSQTSSTPEKSGITIVKEIDKATPLLYKALLTQDHIGHVKFEFFREVGTTGPKLYYEITLQNVLVYSVKPTYCHVRDNNFSYLEEVAFDFESITWKYTNYNPDGSAAGVIEYGWDFATQHAI